MRNSKAIKSLLLSLLLLICAACGGSHGSGGPSGPPTTSAVTLSSTGTPSSTTHSTAVTLVLPPGVTPALNPDGTVQGSVVTASGNAQFGSVSPVVYTPATATSNGTLHFVITAPSSAGFGAGEFATVNLQLAPGVQPQAGQFVVTGFTPTSSTGSAVTGITPAVNVENS